MACGGGGGGGGGGGTEAITGTLVDSSSIPIPGASVTITSNPVTTQTNFSGIFSAEVEPGAHHLVAIKDGTTFLEMDFTVVTGSSLDLGSISPTTPYQYVENPIPIADAGTAQNVMTGTLVTVDGSASSDANGDSLTYAWTLTSKPAGSVATLTGETSVQPTFTADVPGAYVATLVVNDGTSNSTAKTVTVTAATGNVAPVADAGTAQNVTAATLVTLDGSASSDSNGDSLTYAWTLTSKPAGSVATLTGETSVQPTFTADVPGAYVATLVVNDGTSNSTAKTVTVTAATGNVAPVADAGTAQNVMTGTLVTLDGSASSDANGDSLTYAWTLTSKPAGSVATLTGINSAGPTLLTDIDGAYIFSLVVSDGQTSSTLDSVTVISSSSNSAPVADAGPNQNVVTGVAVTLDGTASSDADGDTLTYLWSISSKPVGSLAGGQITGSIVTFTADIDGTYVLSLVVNDGSVSSTPVLVTITATTTNAAPVAYAGINPTVFTGLLVTLDGSGSSDANGDSLTYSWALISQPAGSGTVSLSNSTSVAPTFTPPIAGTYVFALVVNDGVVNSDPHTVVVTAVDATPPPFVFHFLYGGPSYATYLGCLNCNSFDSESVCNEFGNYGSSFAVYSIWNEFGTYGSQFNSYSPWNSFSSSGPAIIGSDGLFYGYFTTNSFRFNRTLISNYLNVLDYFSTTSNLSATRTFACVP